MCICLDLGTSHLLWQFETPDRVYGICTNITGTIYACVKETNEIKIVYADSFARTPFLSEKDDPERPVNSSAHDKIVLVDGDIGIIQVFRQIV